MTKIARKKGFTLIELLVVISIIGLLSSVILTSLNTANLKAKDASVEEEVSQLNTLLMENNVDTGSYIQLQPQGGGEPPYGWFYDAAGCQNYIPSGNYQSGAIQLCTSIVQTNASYAPNTSPGTAALYLGNNINNSTKYSINAWLPGKKVFFCMGSNGETSSVDTGALTSPGCFYDTKL